MKNPSRKNSLNIVLSIFCLLSNWGIHYSAPLVLGCSDSERAALSQFAAKLIDPSNLLSSWRSDSTKLLAPDCCNWSGVTCHNATGFVTELDLRSGNLSGEIHPALAELKHLQSLDLSLNAFAGVKIPDFLGSLKELRYLNLSRAGFAGSIPHRLGNLSNLESLDLSSYTQPSSSYLQSYNLDKYRSSYLSSDNSLEWMLNMQFLKHVNLINVNLSMASSHWFDVINSLPSLQVLQMRGSSLSNIPMSASFLNLTRLTLLDLSYNQFHSQIPNWVLNLTSLVSIDLCNNEFHGEVPSGFGELPRLEELRLGFNYQLGTNCGEFFEGRWASIRSIYLYKVRLHGLLSNSIGNLTSLRYLYMGVSEGYPNILGIPKQLGNLYKLETLSLAGFEDSFLAIHDWLCPLKNLQILFITNCRFQEPIPACLGGFSSLAHLSIEKSGLKGVVSEEHLENLTSLKSLDLSSNSLEFRLPQKWVPPFQTQYLYLRSCRIGPEFPSWIQTQKSLQALDLYDTSLSIMPSWFWNFTPKLSFLILGMNNISYDSNSIPNNTISALPNAYIDLSHNNFRGPVPYLTNPVILLDLSNNQFSGGIPSTFGKMKQLAVLNLSNNNFTGSIPLSLADCESLVVLDLRGNRLSGHIPWSSVTFMSNIQSLHLSKNELSGQFPSFLKDCSGLKTLDLGENNFNGPLPIWVGTNFPMLKVLRLRSNMFNGTIFPHYSSNLNLLQVLDVSNNRLTGHIPQTLLESLTAMRMTQITTNSTLDYLYGYYHESVPLPMNGMFYEYNTTLPFFISLDLSGNFLSGKIPEVIGDLIGLVALHLSANRLSGKIPETMGNLRMLINLDLSRNQLSGSIPPGIADLTSLSYLNLSYNNLSGMIPSGHQIQTLDNPGFYAGNQYLCGYPLQKKCSTTGKNSEAAVTKDDDGHEEDIIWFCSGVVPGFVVGLVSVFGVLVFKSSWRIKYLRFADRLQGGVCL
ncbi:hypothetical protein H6P81_017450 [Aristolochia fimbriata]|uniref:Leucine-rich repeat-containing N-terminal plant-type domain-containing protein n=1 Tax=Aristolochia fimbriata TaxID=158543 RepID=A0AAV7E140_ARIFI|nr:hypothetical protein H6P81_017450 [Aristolochia fimbriata]